ncbi:MAG: ribonuclease E/G [Pseudomonadota bacterium]
MKGRIAIIDDHPSGTGKVAALLVDGRLEDLVIDDPNPKRTQPEQIYRARLDRPLKGMGGAIVQLGNGQTGFLKEAKGRRPGTSLLVQVSTHAEPGKAAPVTPRLLFKSRYAIVTPHAPGLNIARRIRDEEERERLDIIARAAMESAESGLILRSACAGADPDEIAEDIAEMLELSRRIAGEAEGAPERLLDVPDALTRAWRDWSDPDPDEVDRSQGSFDTHGVWDHIDALRSARVSLGGGAHMTIEPTTAFVAVDVNTGGDMSQAAGLKANLAAVRALPRQLRLRGLGGQIVADLAPMPKGERRGLESSLRAALKADTVETTFIGWTPLGHAELTRKRERIPLREVLPA